MANDFQTVAKQLTTSFAEFVPGINTATTNQTVHAVYFSNITTSSVEAVPSGAPAAKYKNFFIVFCF